MLRTAFLSICLALTGYAAATWLTHDFQVWTAEGARRLDVALHPVATPGVMMEGPGLPLQPLAAWLADGQSVTLLDFVYTRCQTVCLALGSTFQQLQGSLQQGRSEAGPTHPASDGREKVRLLTVSFDGAYDTPERLQRYAQGLGADPAVWTFARLPDPSHNARLLHDFQVLVVPDRRGDFEHNAALLVIDSQGQLIRIFDYAEWQLALDYARHIARAGAP